jgi:hypothetical protein
MYTKLHKTGPSIHHRSCLGKATRRRRPWDASGHHSGARASEEPKSRVPPRSAVVGAPPRSSILGERHRRSPLGPGERAVARSWGSVVVARSWGGRRRSVLGEVVVDRSFGSITIDQSWGSTAVDRPPRGATAAGPRDRRCSHARGNRRRRSPEGTIAPLKPNPWRPGGVF